MAAIEPLGAPERYRAAIQLIGSSEAATWQRMAAFLTIAGLLLGADTLAKGDGPIAPLVAGALLSCGFSILTLRNRRLITAYVDYAKTLEASDGPLTAGDTKRFLFGAGWIAPVIPVDFFVVFAWLALAKWLNL